VVIKLDVEGLELQVLEGGQEFIERANIVYLQVELCTKNMKTSPHQEDYCKYTLLDVDQSHTWKHFKHPRMMYFDVISTKQPNPSWVLSR
jgi:hypothetical protein